MENWEKYSVITVNIAPNQLTTLDEEFLYNNDKGVYNSYHTQLSGQKPSVGIKDLTISCSLLDSLATEAQLNQVTQYNGMDNNEPGDNNGMDNNELGDIKYMPGINNTEADENAIMNITMPISLDQLMTMEMNVLQNIIWQK